MWPGTKSQMYLKHDEIVFVITCCNVVNVWPRDGPANFLRLENSSRTKSLSFTFCLVRHQGDIIHYDLWNPTVWKLLSFIRKSPTEEHVGDFR